MEFFFFFYCTELRCATSGIFIMHGALSSWCTQPTGALSSAAVQAAAAAASTSPRALLKKKLTLQLDGETSKNAIITLVRAHFDSLFKPQALLANYFGLYAL